MHDIPCTNLVIVCFEPIMSTKIERVYEPSVLGERERESVCVCVCVDELGGR